MGTLATNLVSPANPKLSLPSLSPHYLYVFQRRNSKKLKHASAFPVARLFGPAIFEASKLKVLFLGADDKKHPGHNIPRTYTLTHSDVTSKITLAISQSINNSQGWYNKLQRDEVVAEWKKVKGVMSLHVHCHISGGHFLLDLLARLRYYIFCNELPVVLKAFVHGDVSLFKEYPELEDALVWVYFHSNIPEFNKVECWGSLRNADQPSPNSLNHQNDSKHNSNVTPEPPCVEDCTCCFPPMSSIPWPSKDLELENGATTIQQQRR
uniref:Staygreen protein domain-containing protein n=1 Tax=Kalanchoe fedtschenkoi TaxID=63787 RepID=A0A7N0RBH5_KALFE